MLSSRLRRKKELKMENNKLQSCKVVTYHKDNQMSCHIFFFKKGRTSWLPNSFFHDLIKDLARDVTSSSVLCLRMALTDIPILVDCGDTLNQNPQAPSPAGFRIRRYLKQLQSHGYTPQLLQEVQSTRLHKTGNMVRECL